jgi:23S rRNA (adenine2503-C2)-methyltransferase
MTKTARDIWITELATRASFADSDVFARAFDLREYRLRQLYRAVAKELCGSFEEVTTLPKSLREAFHERGVGISSIAPVTVQHSRDRQTTKGLFRLHDEKEVEAVLMEHSGDRNTVCISSQAGCAFACAFCSTGQAGFGRNLTAVEIFDQVLYFGHELKTRGKHVTSVVFMGMGEPFHNYRAVMDAVALLNDSHGFGLGHRHITISTVGLVNRIDDFSREGIQVNLAISLHAPNDALRSSFMPVNRRYSLVQLMAACERYVKRTNRKVFFEYIMLGGVNDSDECAHELAALMRGHLYHVNLIPYNSTPDADFTGSSHERIWRFAAILDEVGVPVTVRRNMGRDIAAACGQLRAETQPKAQKVPEVWRRGATCGDSH